MPQPWIIRPPATPSPELLAAVGGSPLVARLLAQRGIDTPAKAIPFLDPDRYTPAPPASLVGVAEAAALLHAAVERGDRILVWGDFDVDGQTSTSLLVTALRTLAGDDRVRFHVPNRFDEGHGIKLKQLEAELNAARDEGAPVHLLLSCDTGITEGLAVGYAKDRGLTVVITDHHDLPADLQESVVRGEPLWGQLPAVAGRESVRRADAIVNPKFLPPGDPLRTLPGVGVAFKLVQELYALSGRSHEEDELLDLVALGIVADVAEQVHDARYLLQRGLSRLRATRRVGLLGLMNIARIEPAALTADSIGYQLGPRMNALGRLEDATVSVELLTTRDAIRAGQLAAKLERLNQDRRQLTTQTFLAALDMIERDPKLLEYHALVLAHPNWHLGIVGIVASKLVEQFGKPTVLIVSPTSPPGAAESPPARGSARSAPGVDIGAAIAACAPLLIAHGGHPGAAGVTLLPQNVDAFRRELSRQVERHRDENVQVGLQIDVETRLDELSLDLAVDLARLAPFGLGNPTPQFVTYGLQVVDDRRIGREGTHRRLTVRGSSAEHVTLPVLWFGGADAELPTGPLDLVYTLNVNEYKGERTLQLMYVDSRAAQEQVAAPIEKKRRAPEIVDLRQLDDAALAAALAAALPVPEQAAWFAEGTLLPKDVPYSPRGQLAAGGPREMLVFWSIPPSAELLRWAIDTVRPAKVYLGGRQTSEDALDKVLRHVAGMCKYAINNAGAGQAAMLDVNRMAARLGVTEAAIRQALLWLEARGELLLLEWQAGDAVRVAAGDNQPHRDQMREIENDLHWLLAETRAYRRFFQRARTQEIGTGDD